MAKMGRQQLRNAVERVGSGWVAFTVRTADVELGRVGQGRAG